MADKSVLWKGRKYLLPQAASNIDSSALAKAPLGGGGVVVIIGDMVGLVPPKTAKPVGSPSTALALIHPNSEEARLASQLVFDPSPGSDTPGASDVLLVPVNPATTSTLTLDAVLKLDSYLYGIPANQVAVKVENGTATGKKITTKFGQSQEVFDNLAKDSFSIQYTGAGTDSLMTIDVTAAGHTLTTACTGAAGDDLALDLNTYQSIQELVDAINATGVYVAEVLTDAPDELCMQLDAVAGQDILPAVYTATSNLQAIVDGLSLSGYVSPSRVADAGAVPSNTSAFTYLAGGTDGASATTDWQQALDALQAVNCNIIIPITSDAATISMVESHCSYMQQNKQERRCFVGGDLQSWVSEIARTSAITMLKTAIKNLNSDLAVHACLGSKHYDPNGKLKLYPAYITAAMYAGMAAGGYPVTPLTRLYLRCYGLEVELRIEEINELINAGGAVPITDLENGAGYVVSRQVTTWGKDTDLYRIEFSVGQGADYIAQQVRKRHGLLIGKPGTESMDQTIINLTNGVLEQAKRDEIIRDYDPKKTTLRVDGTIRYVDYSAEPILPVNFIFSTYHLQPTTFTIGL